MAPWWPIDTAEAKGRSCDRCPKTEGQSHDEKNRIYCPDHRHLHDEE